MPDFRLLLWLRWRQFRSDAIYWLRTAGYDPNDHSFSQRLYALYLVLIGAFWAGSMLSWGIEQATFLGKHMTPDALTVWLTAIPWAVLIGQLAVIALALRTTPIKLSFPDMAYVAGAPVDRASAVIFGYVRQVFLRLILFAIIGFVLGVFLVTPVNLLGRITGGLRGAAATVPLVLVTWALAWLLGVLRLVYPGIRHFGYVWLLPVVAGAAAYFVPDVFLWPGRLLLLVIYGQGFGWLLAAALIGAAALVTLLFRFSQRVNMTYAADESIVYARVKALGLMAWRDPRLQLRIQAQSGRARRKPWLSLPRAYGFWGLTSRAFLSYLRHPLLLLMTALWGAVMTHLAVLLLVNQLPVQLWIGWLLAAGFVPPVGLLYVFNADQEERFLRQFIPVSRLNLLAADALLPLIVLILGALADWLLQGFEFEVALIGVVFILILGLLLALVGAAALTNRRVALARFLITAACFGAVAVAGVNFGLTAALGAAGVAILILSGVLVKDIAR
jgi:hypothetical protein